MFQIDPGWPFLLAGLATLAAVILIPPHRETRAMQDAVARVQVEEAFAYRRLGAYDAFLSELEDPSADLVRRLAGTQLNLMPVGEVPLIVDTAPAEPIMNWVERTVQYEPIAPRPIAESRLGSLATGRWRLWMIGSAALSIFLGFVLTPGRRWSALKVDHSEPIEQGDNFMVEHDAYASLPDVTTAAIHTTTPSAFLQGTQTASDVCVAVPTITAQANACTLFELSHSTAVCDSGHLNHDSGDNVVEEATPDDTVGDDESCGEQDEQTENQDQTNFAWAYGQGDDDDVAGEADLEYEYEYEYEDTGEDEDADDEQWEDDVEEAWDDDLDGEDDPQSTDDDSELIDDASNDDRADEDDERSAA